MVEPPAGPRGRWQERTQRPALLARRTVFLLAGAAVATGFLVLGAALVAPVLPATEATAPGFVAVVLLLMASVGLFPGVRDVEVAGADALLGVPPGAATTPEPMRWPHRWRTALWTFIHQVAGLVVGLLLVGSGIAVAVLVGFAVGRTAITLTPATWSRPDDLAGWVLLTGGVAVFVALSVAVTVGLGAAATASAPLLLGPLGEDRLRIAEQRLAREREHVRLSRDLHDGVGHALSAISLQASAGRRLLAQVQPDRDRLAATLEAVEGLAGRAVAELDHTLAALRVEDPENGSGSAPVARKRAERSVGALDLTALPGLLEEHRARGMDLSSSTPGLGVLAKVPPVVSRTAYRVFREALTNAAKHGGPGTVELALDVADGVRMRVANPVDQPVTGLGHGLAGLHETVRLVGGTLHAGPLEGRWTLEAALPGGGRHD